MEGQGYILKTHTHLLLFCNVLPTKKHVTKLLNPCGQVLNVHEPKVFGICGRELMFLSSCGLACHTELLCISAAPSFPAPKKCGVRT